MKGDFLMSRLEEIHTYLISKGEDIEDLHEKDHSLIDLCKEIIEYAHRNQKRANGEGYKNHPLRCYRNYNNLIGVYQNYQIDKDLLKEHGIPYHGVQEVSLLHDVIEDTDFTLNDLEDIFSECGFKEYFNLYIKEPLSIITHDDNVDYETYINIVMTNPIASICKMMDLQDNTFVLDLNIFGERNYQRAQKYLGYLYLINKKYHFIEKADRYRNELNRLNKIIS